MKHLQLVNFRSVSDHPYLLALADLKIFNLVIKGLKLERDRKGQHHLAFPGRRINGQWQLVCETQSEDLRQQLLNLMTQELETYRQAA